jgi:hypothetical protein
MATIKLLLGIICFAFAGSYGLFTGNLLNRISSTVSAKHFETSQKEAEQRTNLIRIAQKEIGTREKTGNNDGRRIKEYLNKVRLKEGNPYCAAFVSWVYAQGGFDSPRSGWSPDLFPGIRLARSALPGNVLGIYFQEYKRIAHVGLIVKQEGNYLISIEGNTNLAGSREGEGVYLKKRHIKTIYKMADWVFERRSIK